MSIAEHEMIKFLQEYIRINTVMPHPDYEAVGSLFAKQAQVDGFLFNRYLLPSGYPCFVITVPGTDPTLPALMLNHHMDVVPVLEPALWEEDPFLGALVDNVLIGRGVQDTKGLGVVHYYALRECVERYKRLARTVHILMVPDEECGGFKGTAHIVEQQFFRDLHVGLVFDEGPSSGEPSELLVKINERRPLQVRITTTGTAGHGSHVHIENSMHMLSRIMHKLVLYQEQQQKKAAQADPGVVTSCNITHMSSSNTGDAYNVVPRDAYAIVDIRISPCDTRAAIEEFLNALCVQEGGSCTVLASVPERSLVPELTSNLYAVVEQIVKQHGMQTRAVVSEGASDLRFYWERGIAGIGFAPFTSVYNAHGINESLTLSELVRAKDIMHDVIYALAGIKD